jgi:hypothetical protein
MEGRGTGRLLLMALTSAAGLLVVAVLVGCDRAPSEQKRADDVAQLERFVVAVVDELDVRFYLDEGFTCHSLVYSRGEFREGDGGCGSPTESYGPFDAVVRRDFDRISGAIKASGVKTFRFAASVDDGGVLTHVSFRIIDRSIEWNRYYLFDPTHAVPKGVGAPNAPRYEQINERWWLVTEVDD